MNSATLARVRDTYYESPPWDSGSLIIETSKAMRKSSCSRAEAPATPAKNAAVNAFARRGVRLHGLPMPSRSVLAPVVASGVPSGVATCCCSCWRSTLLFFVDVEHLRLLLHVLERELAVPLWSMAFLLGILLLT
mmetsp:Transcript_34409/g.78847  ORF Transcript_34409/g.78847 Transcript_34409/m.78847 type:complete len:135 (+) Transcript_34409:238-642(+)